MGWFLFVLAATSTPANQEGPTSAAVTVLGTWLLSEQHGQKASLPGDPLSQKALSQQRQHCSLAERKLQSKGHSVPTLNAPLGK